MSDYYNIVKDSCHMLLRRTYYYYKVKNDGHEVDLRCQNLGDEEATQVAKALMDLNTKVKTLQLSDNNIRDEGATAIANALKSNSTLTTLYLDNHEYRPENNNIGYEGARAIAEALKLNSTLQSLWLSVNNIGAEGATAIAAVLKLNTTLQQLGLGKNNLQDKGAMAMAETLSVNSTLQLLHLHNNSIGVEGILAIAEALKINSTLQHLRLSSNNIGDEGATFLAEALNVNSTLQELKLSGNKIGDKGAMALAEALKRNSTLQQLWLTYNYIEDEGATAMAEALESNSSLQSLQLGGNFIEDVAAVAMVKAFKKNSTLQELELFDNTISETLSNQIRSLLSTKSRGKRRLVIERSKLSIDTATAMPMKSNSPAITLQPLHQQRQVGETQLTMAFSSSTLIAIDRTNVERVVVDYNAKPVELSSEYFEHSLGGQVPLGVSACGEFFRFQDDAIKKSFAVKAMRLGVDNEQRKFDEEALRIEIQMLQQFRHPNIVRMYGYHLSNNIGGTHYLLFEFASQVSLDYMLKTEEGRKVLTFPRRLGILLGVAQGIHFLHTGIPPESNQPSTDKGTAFHWDVKSANICVTSNFGAKLFVGGLGKVFAKDSVVQEAIARSGQLISVGGGGPLETLVYLDPCYEDNDCVYETACDVFALGVVMAEVFTGTRSEIYGTTDSRGGNVPDARSIYHKYVHVGEGQEKPPRKLRKDVDDLILDAPEMFLDQWSSMSLACLNKEQDERPSPLEIMTRLQEMIVRVHCGDTWKATSLGVPGGDRRSGGECCSICQELTTHGLSCSDHYICAAHLLSHKGIASGQDPLECMMEGCRKCYREDEIHKYLPAAVYKHYVLCQDLHAKYIRTFAKMYTIELSNHLDSQIDVALDGIQYLNNKSDRAMVALAHLATGEQTPCPKLVWIVPQKRIVQDGTKEIKDHFKDAFFQETAVYFLCENTYSKGHKDPIIMNFHRKWIKHLLPLVKISLLTLKLAVAETPDLPFPILGVGRPEQYQYVEDLISEESMQFSHETQNTLQDMETWFLEIVDKGESMMAGSQVARIKKLIRSSYEMLSQKALQEENLPKWKPNMTTQIGYDDNGNKCKIKWIKL